MNEVEWDKYGGEVLGPKDGMKRFIGGKSGEVWGCLEEVQRKEEMLESLGGRKIFIGNGISGTKPVWVSPKLVLFPSEINCLHCEVV